MPSAARRKRLEALERRQPRSKPWTDPYDACMRLMVDLQAVIAGKACWVPRPEPAEPWSEETQDAYDRLVAEVDMMHRRLTTPPPKPA